MKTKIENIRKMVQIPYVALCVCGFLLFSILSINNSSPLFPILNFAIVVSLLFLFGGRYRLLCLIGSVPFIECLTLKDSKIGSFYTWLLLIYYIVIIFESIKKKSFKPIISKNFSLLACFVSLSFLIVASELINISTISILKGASTFLYISIPFLCLFDGKSYKKPETMVLVLLVSLLLANCFCFSFLYIFKSNAIPFLERYIPHYVFSYKNQSLSSFRYPGLKGDSNHNSLFILFASCIDLLFLIEKKRHFFLHIPIVIFLQFFAMMGGSKTYVICLTALILIVLFFFFRRTKQKILFLSLATIILFSVLIIVFSIPEISKSLYRLIYVDDRVSFINAISTGRFDIWQIYLSQSIVNPIKFLIGHGINSARLYEHDYHNVIIQSIWEVGLVGSLLYVAYIKKAIFIKKIDNIYLLPIIPILVFGFSLHILYSEVLLVGFIVYREMLILGQKKVRHTCLEVSI